MKLIYKKKQYNKYNNRKILKSYKNKKRLERKQKNVINDLRDHPLNHFITAPKDFRLLNISSMNSCLTFFRNIRNLKNFNKKIIYFSLKEVTEIDYASLDILSAICDGLKKEGIMIIGDYPNNKKAKKLLQESGFLNKMYNKDGKPLPKSKISESIIFQKGSELTKEHLMGLGDLIKETMLFLSEEKKHNNHLYEILSELLGNAIEHSNKSEKGVWQLGVKFKDEIGCKKVIFSVIDIGDGILKTLYKKPLEQIFYLLKLKSDHQKLREAFNNSYGSKTKERNRGLGLPSILKKYQQKSISKLIVITNNVYLDFYDEEKSFTFAKGSSRLKGTFYQWELTSNNIKND